MAQLPSVESDRHWLLQAIELSRRCEPSTAAFSVGAVLVSPYGRILGYGYSREFDQADHAEEVALARAAEAGVTAGELAEANLYSSLEPCAARSSRPVPCADLIIGSGIRRVVIAWREPPVFVPGGGAALLRKAGIAVAVLPDLAATAKAVNAHLLPGLARPVLPGEVIDHVLPQRAVEGNGGVFEEAVPDQADPSHHRLRRLIEDRRHRPDLRQPGAAKRDSQRGPGSLGRVAVVPELFS